MFSGWQSNQNKKKIDKYCTRIEQLVEELDFEDHEKAIKWQILYGWISRSLNN